MQCLGAPRNVRRHRRIWGPQDECLSLDPADAAMGPGLNLEGPDVAKCSGGTATSRRRREARHITDVWAGRKGIEVRLDLFGGANRAKRAIAPAINDGEWSIVVALHRM